MMEFYPMPLFVKLQVKDIDVAKKWYKEVLDFQTVFDFPEENGKAIMSHLRGSKYQDLMLIASDDVRSDSTMLVNLYADDITKIYEQALQQHTSIVHAPQVQPWNAKEVSLKDIDGYTFTITEVVDESKDFQEVMSSGR